MELERLTTGEGERYQKAMELYEASFPPHEQRNSVSQEKLMEDGEYHFNLIYEEAEFVGILLCWETERFIYVEHFCILPEMRSRGCGQKALALLHQYGKPVILEIDPPVDQLSLRRKAFYERAGYRENSFLHVHPPYREKREGHPLTVMSFPDGLSDEEYEAFNRYLCERVMGN